ncbi:MAG: VOC family protein [Bacteroidia bacterium]
MKPDKNVVGWFEIPVTDMERAVNFYQTVFDIELERHSFGDQDMAWFPFIETGMGAAGSLVHHKDHYSPSQQGVLIYFTALSGDVANELKRVRAAGGKVLRAKTQISEDVGYMGLFLDTEGNRIAVHSRQ